MANAIYQIEPMRCVATLDDGRDVNALCQEYKHDADSFEIVIERTAVPFDFAAKFTSLFENDDWTIIRALVPKSKVNIDVVWQGPLQANRVVDPMKWLRGN